MKIKNSGSAMKILVIHSTAFNWSPEVNNETLYRIGFWAGLFAFSATVSYCVVQVLQLYGILTYPIDEIIIYATSLCIVLPFIIEILALHYLTPNSKKFWSHAALIFAT